MSKQIIALVGLSGAGKSSVGRLLAERLGWPLLDTDALIAEAAGRGVPQIFAEDGEARFRDLEAAALRAALGRAPAIVATGGGIVLRAENRALLRERAFCVWLDAPVAALVARLRAHDEQRPLLEGDMAARLAALRAARAALYAEAADARIDTEARSAEEVAERVLLAGGITVVSDLS
ncbi:shikimate kinase [Kouleothrix sp.]|uniref:shikimate kinase n=1 Tax=Kouleothrix sp. TaxID=2779161 RepID=UPI00391DBA8E